MNYEIKGGDAFPLLHVHLERGESIKAESNAMVTMSGNLDIEGKFDGGLGKAIARRLAGESAFLQKITATKGAGDVHLGTFLPGSIEMIRLQNTTLQVQQGSFLAADTSIDVSAKVQSLTKMMFGGEGIFAVRVSGTGDVFLSSYGGIQEFVLAEGEDLIVDNGHLVAWDDHLDYSIKKGSGRGWFSSFTSGEVLVLHFKGPGRVWVQSRNIKDFKNWILSFLPKRQRG